MKHRVALLLLVVVAPWMSDCSGASDSGSADALPVAEPVMQCDTRDPTRDKPQSKVWFAAGSWWAWLPYGKSGSDVWRRLESGRWQSQKHLKAALKGLPGRADVLVVDDRVFAVLVHRTRLAVVALQWQDDADRYELSAGPLVWVEEGSIETVTIAQMEDGFLCVAYPVDDRNDCEMVVREITPDLGGVGERTVLVERVWRDEVCALTSLDGEAVVLWSDQRENAFTWRRRVDGPNGLTWTPAEHVVRADDTANDHINLAVPEGDTSLTLLVATKTRLAGDGEPVLALRVLGQPEQWWSVPYAANDMDLKKQDMEPSRPVALWLGGRPVSLYSVGGKVALQEFTPDGKQVHGSPRIVLNPKTPVFNVTGPKVCPPGRPCLLLASDEEGAVYEVFVE